MYHLLNTKSINTPQKSLTVRIKMFNRPIICFLILFLFSMTTYGQINFSQLEKHLNPDGTINTSSGISSSLYIKDQQMIPDIRTSEPKFYKNTDDPNVITWENVGGAGSTNYGVRAIVIDFSGNVYVGGVFTTIVGISAKSIAKWDGSTWSAHGSGMNNTVSTITVIGSDVYAGGIFTSAGGVSANGIAKWNGSTWSALGSGLVGNVYAISVSGSDVYVGGSFTSAGGVSANNIAKWDGSTWFALSSGMNNGVYAITVSGSDVYAWGVFGTAGGVSANRIAKWNGSTWSALGSGANDFVYAIVVNGSDVYAGGRFTTAGGVSANNIAKWNGSIWSALGSGTNDFVYALSPNISDGKMYVGGNFTTAGGITASRIARFTDSENPLPVGLSLFTADVNNNDVDLNWTTEWEINNTGFDIERQFLAGGKDIWTKIGFVEGYGTTNEPKNYSFQDRKLRSGKYNYKLVQRDFNNRGVEHFLSNVVTVGIPNKYDLSQNYPNPFNPTTKIDFELSNDSKVIITIFDILGRDVITLVNEIQIAGYYTIDFNASNLASGIYYYRMSANDFSITKKMMLIK